MDKSTCDETDYKYEPFIILVGLVVVKWLLAVAWEWRKNKLRKIEIGRQNEMINMLDNKIETVQDTMNTILLNQNQQSREIRVLRNNFNSRPKSLQSESAVPNIFHPQFCSR